MEPTPVVTTAPLPAKTGLSREEGQKRMVQFQTAQAVLGSQAPGLTFLESVSVSDKVRRDYESRVQTFESWASSLGMVLFPIALLELALLEFLHLLFWEGLGAGEGAKLLSALSALRPNFQADRHLCLRLPRALAGWSKMRPPHTRLPIPWLVIHLWVIGLLLRKQPEMALATMLAADAYFRPGEVMVIRCGGVIPPVVGGTNLLSCWAVSLFEARFCRASKTHNFDDTIVLDSTARPYLGPLLGKLAASRPADSMLFTFRYLEWAKEAHLAAVEMGLEKLELVLYMLRHSGPSNDIAEKHRSLQEVQNRGRWASKVTVRRYEKHGQLNKQLQLLPPKLLRFSLGLGDRMASYLAGAVVPRPPVC